MDGLLNMHKPVGLTSAQTLYRVRKITGQRKSGHAGTLDRLAEGVLLICLGRGTKLVESLMDLPKVYRATARLDVTSVSYDSAEPHEPVGVAAIPGEATVQQALGSFEGEIQQVPPTISALKVRGRAAHKLSRSGAPPALEPRTVRVYWTHLYAYDWPTIEFAVACSRGTYVRALIRDLGTSLATGGCLTTLVRESIGPFQLAESWTLEDLDKAAVSDYLLEVMAARERVTAAHGEQPRRPN